MTYTSRNVGASTNQLCDTEELLSFGGGLGENMFELRLSLHLRDLGYVEQAN